MKPKIGDCAHNRRMKSTPKNLRVKMKMKMNPPPPPPPTDHLFALLGEGGVHVQSPYGLVHVVVDKADALPPRFCLLHRAVHDLQREDRRRLSIRDADDLDSVLQRVGGIIGFLPHCAAPLQMSEGNDWIRRMSGL